MFSIGEYFIHLFYRLLVNHRNCIQFCDIIDHDIQFYLLFLMYHRVAILVHRIYFQNRLFMNCQYMKYHSMLLQVHFYKKQFVDFLQQCALQQLYLDRHVSNKLPNRLMVRISRIISRKVKLILS